MDKKTILVVDDEGDTRYLLKEFFTTAGFNVLLCENGTLAIPHISKADLFITDFNMPGGMNGAELNKITKREKPGMPVIIMTGAPLDVPVDHLANKVIEKPFKFEQLEEVIADLLKEKGGCCD